jgi:transcriptional regulator GlxA family with amidase domain
MDINSIKGEVRPICIIAFPGADILDITGPTEVFALTNICLQRDGIMSEPAYPISILAEKPGPIKTASGVQIVANPAFSEIHGTSTRY